MEEVIKQIASKYNKDIRVTKAICEYPLLFAKRRIEDPNDIRPIMITYFGKFVLKKEKSIEDKEKNVERLNKLKANRLNRKKDV